MFSYRHSFARQILWEQRRKIFANDAEILSYRGKIYDIPEMRARIPVGSIDFQPSEQIMKVHNVQKLADLGFKIISKQFKGWFKGQKQRHELVRLSSSELGLKDVPPEHFVEYDLLNKTARLRGRTSGKFGVGEWKFSTAAPQDKKRDNYLSAYLEDRARLLGEERDVTWLEIPEDELPVMVDDQGRIVCIQQQNNEPCIGVVGQRRMGNSWLLHALLDRAYHRWHILIVALNDGLDETDTWCLPWKEFPTQPNVFARNLKKLGEFSVPLPCIYLTPHHRDVTDDDVFYPKEVGFRTSLSFRAMALDYENFFKGNDKWIFKNSMPYFRTLLFNEDGTLNDRFINAQTFGEIKDVMEEMWFNEDGELDKNKVAEGTFMKISNVLKDIWDSQILDNTNKIPPKWKVQLPSGEVYDNLDPFVACLMCNLVPILRSRKIKKQPWFPQEFKYRLEQIFDAQVENPYFKKNKLQVWIAIDELQSIAATDNKTVASAEIERVVNQSGPARIGLIYRAQNHSKVLPVLRDATGYFFAFKQVEESAKALLKNFGITPRRDRVEELTSLKRFEVVAFTTHKFIVYDPITGKREEISDKPIRGRVDMIPPLSWHKPPRETGK